MVDFSKLHPEFQEWLLQLPAQTPPPGVGPTPNRRNIAWVVVILCSVVTTLEVFFRLYSRAFITKRFMLEDYMVIAAYGTFAGFQYFIARIMIFPGYYVHTWDIQLKDLLGFLFNISTGATIHGAVIMLLKVAIFLDLMRIFTPAGARGAFFWTCQIAMWINIVFYTTTTFLEVFGCTPREKAWNPLLSDGRCINMNALVVASSAINLPSDLIIFVLPQRAIWRLHLSWGKRLGISAVFAIALLFVACPTVRDNADESSGCFSAAIRLVRSTPLLSSNDVVYVFGTLGIWIECEITAGFLVLGMPALPKIIKRSPFIQRCVKFIRCLTGTSMAKEKPNSRRGLPSWYRHQSRRRRNIELGWSEADFYVKSALAKQSCDFHGCVRENCELALNKDSRRVQQPAIAYFHGLQISQDANRNMTD